MPRFLPMIFGGPDSETRRAEKGVKPWLRPWSAAKYQHTPGGLAFPREIEAGKQPCSGLHCTALFVCVEQLVELDLVLQTCAFAHAAQSSITRSGLGWPTRSRALALTAFTVENVFFFARFFALSRVSPNVTLPLNPCYPYNAFVTVTGGYHGRARFFRRKIRAKDTYSNLSALRQGGRIPALMAGSA